MYNIQQQMLFEVVFATQTRDKAGLAHSFMSLVLEVAMSFFFSFMNSNELSLCSVKREGVDILLTKGKG